VKVLISAVLLFPAALALGQNLAYQQDLNWRAPASAATRLNPLATRPDAAAGGRKLFLRNCAECHNPEGSGMTSKHSADLQLPAVQAQTDGTLFWKITNGNAAKGMPSFSKLPEMQRWQIVLYIRLLKPTAVSTSKN
jgi:mono/diheme cytochrome c family protein